MLIGAFAEMWRRKVLPHKKRNEQKGYYLNRTHDSDLVRLKKYIFGLFLLSVIAIIKPTFDILQHHPRFFL